MTYLEITAKHKGQTDALLKNNQWNMNIPVRLTGRATTRFSQKHNAEKLISIDPDIIHVFREGNHLYSIKEIKVSRFFNRIAIEGVDTTEARRPIITLSDDIKLMWADDYRYDNDIWNIEL